LFSEEAKIIDIASAINYYNSNFLPPQKEYLIRKKQQIYSRHIV
jgi:predicted adenine nucleotide alpha hydrolase (AANH) superfamily ATPase